MRKDEQREKFEKRLYDYMIRLIKFLNEMPKTTVIFEIIKQLMRSGTSIGANYFESKAASSKKDFQNFFSYSLKSSNESLFWLSILKNSNLVPENLKQELKWLLIETQEFANILASSILTMKNNR